MHKVLLEARGLKKSFEKGGKTISVLERAELKLLRGSITAITGKSGAGKSTLLHVLGTLDLPDAGEVYFEGEDLLKRSTGELAHFRNHHLGFVFQFHHLLADFSALENVAMPCLIRGLSKSEAYARAEEALIEVALKHRVDHKPSELSGGEQQRVALARALVLNPPLILADEVTGNLDAKTGDEVLELLWGVNERRGTTLVLVTHSQTLACRAQRCLVLRSGVLEEA